jgi:hypothetical protein
VVKLKRANALVNTAIQSHRTACGGKIAPNTQTPPASALTSTGISMLRGAVSSDLLSGKIAGTFML